MATAVADLPDPLEAETRASAMNADDLLAEMAGEEIDRLLAEAEEGRTPVGPARDLPVESADAPPPAPPIGAQLDQLFAELSESQQAEASGGPATIEVAGDVLPEAADDPGHGPRRGPDQRDETPDVDPQAEVDSGEGSGFRVPGSDSDLSPEPRDLNPGDVPRRTPLLVRLLELINAPLAGCSPGVHQAIGKAAIVTLLNAVAVMVYVLLFR